MDYWEGVMSWPIDAGWKCEACGMTPPGSSVGPLLGEPFLTWGFRNGTCRCDVCHVQYTLRDWWTEGNPIVTTPICLLRPEYKAAFIKLWAERQRPVDQITEEEWDAAGIVVAAIAE